MIAGTLDISPTRYYINPSMTHSLYFEIAIFALQNRARIGGVPSAEAPPTVVLYLSSVPMGTGDYW